MTEADLKTDLHDYLRKAREAVCWKVDGLSEYDVRRPLTPTGTNLLGLVKHLATVELLYLGMAFGRHFEQYLPWFREDAEPNQDMWATADESREYILDLYRRAGEHADATIEALPLDAIGEVPWWTDEGGKATLHRILTHLLAETHRHTGQADIVRELIDGRIGEEPGDDRIPSTDAAWWQAYRDNLERIAAGSRLR
ncbi:DinB family protein [Kribbella deserti]|uniref:DinB family protein n=1 Tax=Kribbella deserti TaxID=1926257 RepID=A0ABV6QM26_9ACTN